MILALNGSPRLNGNTAAMLKSVLEGAQSCGAETRLVHVYPLKGKGCVSCFSCKRKNGRHGYCALQDEFSPLLAAMEEADAIIFGSPIYYYNATPEILALEQRFLFSHMLYNTKNRWVYPKKAACAFVYTFGLPESFTDEILHSFRFVHTRMGEMMGSTAEILCSADASQFSDYSLYEADRFDPAAKKKHLEEVFPQDLARAFTLGQKLASHKN